VRSPNFPITAAWTAPASPAIAARTIASPVNLAAAASLAMPPSGGAAFGRASVCAEQPTRLNQPMTLRT
jgi:hypothetical protein